MSHHDQRLFLEIAPAFAGIRVDKALSELLPEHSRATIQQWLKEGRVLVDGAPVKQRFPLAGFERVEISVPHTSLVDGADWPAQKMDFDVLHRDEDIFVINKPAGMVVHPGAGQADHTLLNGLLHVDDTLRALPRAGIVHRLDKNTSGLLVVARNEVARQRLTTQLADHSMKRRYLAVVNGVMVAGERIAQPIGRHRRDRLRMCVTESGKPAVTHIRVEKKFRAHSLIRVELETGRTHQIRVHMHWRGFPLVGDCMYAGRVRLPPQSNDANDANDELTAALRQFPRQALHATHLSLRHPHDGAQREWHQPTPADLQHLIDELEKDRRRHVG